MPPKRAATTAQTKTPFGPSSKRSSSASTTAKGALVGTSSAAAKGKGKAAAPTPPSRSISPDKKATTFTKAQLDKVQGLPELDPDSPSWNKVWQLTREKMGEATYQDNDMQNRITHILRVFDFDPTYGPALGLTRLERWERARNLGDDPPHEIAEILRTKQGVLMPELRESVLTGMGV